MVWNMDDVNLNCRIGKDLIYHNIYFIPKTGVTVGRIPYSILTSLSFLAR